MYQELPFKQEKGLFNIKSIDVSIKGGDLSSMIKDI